jgi:putative drug exporter of the RND superfamily
MLTRLGWLVVRRRRVIVALTVLFMVVGAVVGTRAFGVLKGGGFDDPSSQSELARTAIAERFGGGEPNVVLVVRAASNDAASSNEAGAVVDQTQVADAGRALAEELDAVAGVEQVNSYWSLGRPATLRSADGDTALILGRAVGDEEAIKDTVLVIQDQLQGANGILTVLVGGGEAVGADISSTIGSDLL